MKTILKIDLDLKSKEKSIKLLSERLNFLDKIKLLPTKFILDIELIKKKNYSAKIYLSKKPISNEQVIIIQAILGDDFKRVGINYRDLLLNISSWNRLFIIKKYPNGQYKKAKIFKVKNKVLNYDPRK